MSSQVRLVQIGAATGGANIQIGKTGALLTAQIAQPLQGVPAGAAIQLGKFNNASGTFYRDPSNPSGGTPGQPIQVGTSIAGRTLGYITGTGVPSTQVIQSSGYFSIWNNGIVQGAFQIQTPSTGVQAKPAASQVNNHQRQVGTISDVVNHQRAAQTIISDVINHQRKLQNIISDVINHQRTIGTTNDQYLNYVNLDLYGQLHQHSYTTATAWGFHYHIPPTNTDGTAYLGQNFDYTDYGVQKFHHHFNNFRNIHQRITGVNSDAQVNHQRAIGINSDAQVNHQRTQGVISDAQVNHQRAAQTINNDTRTPQTAIPASGTLYNGYWVNTQPGAQGQVGSTTGSTILLNIGQMGTLTTQGGSIQSTGPATGQYQVAGTFNQNQVAGQATAVVQTQQGVVVWGGTPATAHN
jgi:hypothetical protein